MSECTLFQHHGSERGSGVVRKDQKAIRLVAADMIDDGTVRSIKPGYVFDMTQTQERPARAAA